MSSSLAACVARFPVALRHDLKSRLWRRLSGQGNRELLRPAPGRASDRAHPVPVPTAAFLQPGAAWWKVPKPANVTSVNSVQQLVDELDAHKEGLVVVEFFGTWCSSCRSLLPHIIKLAEQDPTVHWVLIDYDDNKPLGRGLGVTGLPSLLVFDGARGCVERLATTAGRLDQLTEALDRHRNLAGSRPAGSIPPLPAFPTVRPRKQPSAQPQQAQQQQQQSAHERPLQAICAEAELPQVQQQGPNTLSNVVELPSSLAREAAYPDTQ